MDAGDLHIPYGPGLASSGRHGLAAHVDADGNLFLEPEHGHEAPAPGAQHTNAVSFIDKLCVAVRENLLGHSGYKGGPRRPLIIVR